MTSNQLSKTGSKIGSKIVKRKVGKVLNKGLPLLNPLVVIKEMKDAYVEYHKIKHIEETKRVQIRAWERTTLEKLAIQREILMEYLTRSFDERKMNFDMLFDSLDAASREGNTELVALVLKSIVDLAQSSPFKDLGSTESVRRILASPDTEFEF